MSQSNSNSLQTQGIKNNWSLVAFAKEFGPKVKLAEFTNKDTNESFMSLVFINDKGEKQLVGFASKIGELSAKEIAERQASLQVVQLMSNKYYLCATSGDAWQDVILDL